MEKESTPSTDLKMENPIAAYSLFLVEGVGDSEDPAWNADACETGGGVHDVDDAESCSCDGSEHRVLDDPEGCDSGDVGAGADRSEEELQSHQLCLFNQDLQSPPAEHKSCVSVDSASPANELMNEMERSRLFWEACLASS